jgi:hypothetical protein
MSISLVEQGRVMLRWEHMRETRLFVLGHLSLLVIAILGSSL